MVKIPVAAGNPSQHIMEYHERTKHQPYRFARSPGYLDWKTEPDPFRRYEGTVTFSLPLEGKDSDKSYLDLYKRDHNPFQPFSFMNVALFLELSLGLSAWKSYRGSSWALRMNPSSGNLHPTEAHLILPPLPEMHNRGGVYHYSPLLHVLEQRASFDRRLWLRIRDHFRTDGFFVGLTSIYWREAWKYGERAFRYCNHDTGHATACLSLSANLLGWKVTYLNALSDEETGTLMGLDKTEWIRFEEEHPELLLFVHGSSEKQVRRGIPPEIIQSFQSLLFEGRPNRLSSAHMDWQVIDEVSAMSGKPKTPERRHIYNAHEFTEYEMPEQQAIRIIRQRRSGLAFDRKTGIPKKDLFGILDRTLPRNHHAPFDSELGETSIHLLIFVHKINGLESGLYFLIRNEKDFQEIRQRCHSSFLWEKVKDRPETLPLYLLKEGNFRAEGRAASCHQDIAGDGVFSLAMIAKFRERIEELPSLYRYLHWETGMIGQVLYLEAEAHSVRGTGMGCFFDDTVHELLGLSDNEFQDLYHFAVGKAVDDERLTTLPPYYHLRDRREEKQGE